MQTSAGGLASPRLAALAAAVPDDLAVADVGCDHGFVAIELARRSAGRRVYAIDVRPGPVAAAREHVREAGVSVQVLQGDGLQPLKPGDVQAVVIAGMGADAALRILRDARPHWPFLQCVVLSPHTRWAASRAELSSEGFVFHADGVLFDGRRPYLLLAGRFGGPPAALSLAEQELGQASVRQDGPDFQRWVLEERDRLRRAADAAGTPSPKLAARLQVFEVAATGRRETSQPVRSD